MFVGRSEEEIALAGEEMGWSALQAVKNIFASPAVPVAAGLVLGPSALIALTVAKAATAAQGARAPKARPEPKPESDEKPRDNRPTPSSDDSMGADSFSDDYIEQHIERERDPDKKARMVYNHARAKRMRNSNVGAAMTVVEDSIGELFARTPVDRKNQPTLMPDQVQQLVTLVGKKIGSAAKARTLVAAYVAMNDIATPGLRVVKKGS